MSPFVLRAENKVVNTPVIDKKIIDKFIWQ